MAVNRVSVSLPDKETFIRSDAITSGAFTSVFVRVNSKHIHVLKGSHAENVFNVMRADNPYVWSFTQPSELQHVHHDHRRCLRWPVPPAVSVSVSLTWPRPEIKCTCVLQKKTVCKNSFSCSFTLLWFSLWWLLLSKHFIIKTRLFIRRRRWKFMISD